MVMIPGLSLNERESLGREWLLCGIPGRWSWMGASANYWHANVRQSGKHHVIHELQTRGISSFNYPFLVSDFVILLFFQHPHRVTSNIYTGRSSLLFYRLLPCIERIGAFTFAMKRLMHCWQYPAYVLSDVDYATITILLFWLLPPLSVWLFRTFGPSTLNSHVMVTGW